MSIITDSKGLEDKKDPESCNVFNIYKLIAKKDDINKMKNNYLDGGYGYGNAKKDLFNLRFQKTNSQVTNPSKIGETKKTIARLKTTLKGKLNA